MFCGSLFLMFNVTVGLDQELAMPQVSTQCFQRLYTHTCWFSVTLQRWIDKYFIKCDSVFVAGLVYAGLFPVPVQIL